MGLDPFLDVDLDLFLELDQNFDLISSKKILSKSIWKFKITFSAWIWTLDLDPYFWIGCQVSMAHSFFLGVPTTNG